MNPKLQGLAKEMNRGLTDRNRLTTLWAVYQMFLRKEITHDDYLDFTKGDDDS